MGGGWQRDRQAKVCRQRWISLTVKQAISGKQQRPQEQGRAEWPRCLIPGNIIQPSIPAPTAQACPCIQANSAQVSAANPEVRARDDGHRRSRDPTDLLSSWSILCGCTAIPFHLKIRLCKACRGMTHAEGLSGYRAGTERGSLPCKDQEAIRKK